MDDEDVEPQDFLPGQKFASPDEGEGIRLFYESLLQQNPESKMAEKWMLEHGLLPKERAKVLAKAIKKTK